MLKVGLELFVAEGPAAVRAAAALGRPVFLDLKLHDIPNTVEGAARSAAAERRVPAHRPRRRRRRHGPGRRARRRRGGSASWR